MLDGQEQCLLVSFFNPRGVWKQLNHFSCQIKWSQIQKLKCNVRFLPNQVDVAGESLALHRILSFKRKQYPFVSILYLYFRNADTITLDCKMSRHSSFSDASKEGLFAFGTAAAFQAGGFDDSWGLQWIFWPSLKEVMLRVQVFFCSHAMRKLGWTRSTNLPFRRDWKCCVLDVAVWNFVPSTSPDLFGGSECLCSERCRILSGGVSVHVKG